MGAHRPPKFRGIAQLVARIVRDDEAGGSSPPTPTSETRRDGARQLLARS